MRIASTASRPIQPPRRLHSTLALIVPALALLCSACSSGRKPVHPVRGQILVDGKPAAQAQILFHSAEGGNDTPHPTGHSDAQGYFHLTSYADNDGAPEGDYIVTVTWFGVYARKRDEVVPYNALPKRYAAPQSSQLRVTVAKGNNELNALQLTSR